MEIAACSHAQSWEATRSRIKGLHPYSFSFRWLTFQARWRGQDRISDFIMDEGRPVDAFAGIRGPKSIWAGIGGCLHPERLDLIRKTYNDTIFLNMADAASTSVDINYELVIPLGDVSCVGQFFQQRVSANARRNYKKALSAGVEIIQGDTASFYDCYRELCRRKRVRHPFPRAYFDRLVQDMSDEVLLKTAVMGNSVVGTLLVFITPSVVHNYFVMAKSRGFKTGVPALLYAEMVKEALERGKQWVNLGPSSPWDGTFEFKRRFGAVCRPVYTHLLNATVLQRFLFGVKRFAKRYKTKNSRRFPESPSGHQGMAR